MTVLDTNVVSELLRPSPTPRVIAWFDVQRRSDLHITAVTAAELGYGVARLPPGRRRNGLAFEVARLVDSDFAGRVLPLDVIAAREYGPVLAMRQAMGRPVSIPDAQIAAICLRHGGALATRNTRDFEELGLTLVNPWEEG